MEFGRFAEIRFVGAIVVLAALAACEQHEPRSFQDFMEDAIARDGALARCSRDPVAAAPDVECANARRAAEAVAVAAERARKVELEAQSERRLIALRDRAALEQEAVEQAAAEAQAAEAAAYEAQWVDPADETSPAPAPEGIVAFDVYGQRERRVPALPNIDVSVAAPGPSEITIARPQLTLDEIGIPRPFRAVAADDSVAASAPQ